MQEGTPFKHYKEITLRENLSRLKLLRELQYHADRYFKNTSFNIISGEKFENIEARDAMEIMTGMLMNAYAIIRLADINPSAQSTSTLAVKGNGRNIDLIMNIFNLHKNEIPPDAALEYIERAIDVYKSERLRAFFRTVNPFFWIGVMSHAIARGNRHGNTAERGSPSCPKADIVNHGSNHDAPGANPG